MKIAVCLSGQPRNVDMTYPFVKKNIIDPNIAIGDEVDVFIHMNYDESNPYIEKTHLDNGNCNLPKDIEKYAVHVYQPKRYVIEKPHNFRNPNLKSPQGRLDNSREMNKHRNYTDEQQTEHIFRQLLSSYYSIYKCNEFKEVYANDNGFVYDYVIRLRFDAYPRIPLICRNYDPNFIYYEEILQPDQIISDWFNFGSNAIMNIYASIFLQIEYMNTYRFYKREDRIPNTIDKSEKCSGLAEHMIRDIMSLFKIPKRGINIYLRLASHELVKTN
jgi:hypothetical protein